MTLYEAIGMVKCDISRYKTHSEKEPLSLLLCRNIYRHPSLVGVIYYRVGQWLYANRRNPLCLLLLGLYHLFYPIVRIYSGLELSPRTQIGAGLCILHFGPVVIHPDVVAGENLTLLHRVTLGYAKSGLPRIGNNVSIGVGATIIGGISVGNNVSIGAGAVVTKDIPSDCTAVGVPAKPISNLRTRQGQSFQNDLELSLLIPAEVWQPERP